VNAHARIARGAKLGVRQVHGGLVRSAARPEAGWAHAGERPCQIAASGRDGLDELVRARVQPVRVPRRVIGQFPVCYLPERDGRGRPGGHDLGGPPVTAPEVGGQLPERPSRAGRRRPFQVTVDDPREFGRAGTQLGQEAVVTGRGSSR
jgi:hypothetical protein